MTSESPLNNIFDHAFPLADELSVLVNDSIKKMVANEKMPVSITDAIIVHTVSLMLMICMMNREVLDTGDLEATFRKVKSITHDYLAHVLNLPRERKGEDDDDDAVGTSDTALNS
jgi:hypothetical protein